jgi:hypothetical protein
MAIIIGLVLFVLSPWAVLAWVAFCVLMTWAARHGT